MQEALIILTLLGCDNGEANCEYIETTQAHYETVSDCRADASRVLIGLTDVLYPNVVAKCEMTAPIVTVTNEYPKTPAPTAPIDDSASKTDGWFSVKQAYHALDAVKPMSHRASVAVVDGYSVATTVLQKAWAQLPSIR